MRIVNLGTFLLPVRFSLSALMTGARGHVMSAVAAALPEFRRDAEPESSELLLDFHRSQGTRQMESMIFQGSAPVDGLGVVRLYISSLSVGFVVVAFELPDDMLVDLETTAPRRAFKSYEAPVSAALKPLIEDWSQRIVRFVDPDLTEPRHADGLPAGQLLWWHRIAVNPPAGQESPAARWYGSRAELADGMTVIVGNGVSLLYGDPDKVIVDVTEGLMVATQEWLIVDEAKRLLAGHLVRLSRSRRTGLLSLDAQYLEVLRLTEEVALHNLLLSEEVRYLANARGRVKAAAAACWGMAAEAAELEQRAAALRDLVGLHRERIANERDDRRNQLILVLTVITLIQGVLVWYDFLTTDDVTVAADPRPLIAAAVVVSTAATLIATVSG
ncbi:MAG: hypothetical protein IRY92_03225, partial [Dactylosporangium sp.]|nr:hypothetical protein [Dactylosporangium sp.]